MCRSAVQEPLCSPYYTLDAHEHANASRILDRFNKFAEANAVLLGLHILLLDPWNCFHIDPAICEDGCGYHDLDETHQALNLR